MKKILFILFLFTGAIAFGQTTYYIDPAGNNGNDGSSAHPWLSLYYATTQVTTAGNKIHVNAGNYGETNQCYLLNGVSIEGAGIDISIFHMALSSAKIELSSFGHEGNPAYGNQSISGCTFDGQNICLAGMDILYRCNVQVHDCKFINFVHRAVKFNGQYAAYFTVPNPYQTSSSYPYMPDKFSTGNRFYNNLVIDCADVIDYEHGQHALDVGAQDGFLCYNNIITCTGKAAGTNGIPIGFCYDSNGFNKNTQIYDNTLTSSPIGVPPAYRYDFAIEWWWSLGGEVIRNNRISGSIDIVHAQDIGGTGYSVRIYDNDIGRTSIPYPEERGIMIEGNIAYMQVYRNFIHDVASAFYMPKHNYTGIDRTFHLNIYGNLCVRLGSTIYNRAWGLCSLFDPLRDQALNQYIYIQNNVFISASSNTGGNGIEFPKCDEISDFYIENNIILNFDGSAIRGEYARLTLDNIYIRNNLMYNNGVANIPYYDADFAASLDASYTVVLLTPADPSFVSSTNWHLSSDASPAYRTGRYVGIATDYEGKNFASPPSVGAYEYGTIDTEPPIEPPELPIGLIKHNGRFVKYNGRLIIL